MITDTLNRPLRDLRISVTDRCNFRCAYCMPAEIFGEDYPYLPHKQLLTYEEITRVARIMVKLGVVKLRLTGGEPLLRQDVETLVAMLVAIDGVEDIAMTTNGYLLLEKAQALKDAGLQRVTVSLDTLDGEIFRQMSGGRADVHQVLDGIATVKRVGLSPIKINAVVQRGINEHTILELARFCREKGYILRLIEYMDVGNINGWKWADVVPAGEILQRIAAEMPVEPMKGNYPGEVARRYRYKDGGGEIGLITSVTQPFCGACNRLRLSPEGKLYTCLFATKGTDLCEPIRRGVSDEELEQIIRRMWQERANRYSEIRHKLTGKSSGDKVEMYRIGG